MGKNGKTEKLETGAFLINFSGSSICFAVREIGLEGQLILASAMKNHLGMRKLSDSKIGDELLYRECSGGNLLPEKDKKLDSASSMGKVDYEGTCVHGLVFPDNSLPFLITTKFRFKNTKKSILPIGPNVVGKHF